jgi:hypothetical protein
MNTASTQALVLPGVNRQVIADGPMPLGFIVQIDVPSQPLPVQPPPATLQPGPAAAALSSETPERGVFGQP